MKNKKILNAGIGYLIGNILVKGINFLSIPIFSRMLSTEEFGVFSVFLSYEAILSIFISFALHVSVRSAKYEFDNEQNEYVSSIILIYLLNLIVLILGTLFFQEQLYNLLGLTPAVIYMMILYSFGGGIIALYNEYISLSYSYKKYILVAMFNSIGNVLLSLFLICTIFSNKKELGRILGSTTVILFIGIVLIFRMFKQSKPRFNKKYWKFGLTYSIPIIPHGLSQVALGQFDRIMISNIIGNVEAGIFSLASNIMLILTIMTNSVQTVWNTWFYEQISIGNIKAIQKRSVQFVLSFTMFSIILLAISPELIYILGGEKYSSGKYIAIPMVLDAFLMFLYCVIVPSEYYKKKTVFIMIGTSFAAIIDIILNLIFIPKFGFIAAAYTTLFAYICYLFMHINISYRVIGFFVIPIKYILFVCIIIAMVAAICLIFISTIYIRYITAIITIVFIGAFYLIKHKITSLKDIFK